MQKIETKGLTLVELHERMDKGERWAVGEYRVWKPGTFRGVDKATGRARVGAVARHTLEFGDISVDIAEFAADGVVEGDLVKPFEKGARVALEISAWQVEKGSVTARGRIVPVLDVPVSGANTVASRAGR